MVSVNAVARKIDIVGDCISERNACFFVINLNFNLKLFIKIKVFKAKN